MNAEKSPARAGFWRQWRRQEEWLKKFLDLSAGIPSHGRFNSIFAAIKPEEFERCLTVWIKEVVDLTEGQVIAIDGKTLRRAELSVARVPLMNPNGLTDLTAHSGRQVRRPLARIPL